MKPQKKTKRDRKRDDLIVQVRVRRYQETGDPHLLDMIMHDVSSVINFHVDRSTIKGMSHEEVRAVVNEIVMVAAKGYEEGASSFTTWVDSKIKWALLDQCRAIKAEQHKSVDFSNWTCSDILRKPGPRPRVENVAAPIYDGRHSRSILVGLRSRPIGEGPLYSLADEVFARDEAAEDALRLLDLHILLDALAETEPEAVMQLQVAYTAHYDHKRPWKEIAASYGLTRQALMKRLDTTITHLQCLGAERGIKGITRPATRPRARRLGIAA